MSASATLTRSFPSRARIARVSSHACEIDSFGIQVPSKAPPYAKLRRIAQRHLPSRNAGAMSSGVKAESEIEWRISDEPVPYEEALAFMNERAAAIRDGSAKEC